MSYYHVCRLDPKWHADVGDVLSHINTFGGFKDSSVLDKIVKARDVSGVNSVDIPKVSVRDWQLLVIILCKIIPSTLVHLMIRAASVRDWQLLVIILCEIIPCTLINLIPRVVDARDIFNREHGSPVLKTSVHDLRFACELEF